jgi:hypothetical protein
MVAMSILNSEDKILLIGSIEPIVYKKEFK